jgi:hypothetical protein
VRNHKYDFQEVVVGHSLSAVKYAYENKIPLILNTRNKPFPFDEVEEIDIPELQLKTTNAETAWSFMVLEHAMSGLVPFGTSIDSIRFENNKMFISLGGAFSVHVDFKKCLMFDNENVTIEEASQSEKEDYRVLDWFNVRSGGKHDVDLLKTSESFVNKVYFYKSERVDGNKNIKDCVSESFMTHSELNSFDASPTMVRFKVEKLMKGNGISGAKDGTTIDGKQKFLSIKLEPTRREKFSISKLQFKGNKYIEIMTSSERGA